MVVSVDGNLELGERAKPEVGTRAAFKRWDAPSFWVQANPS